MTTLAVSVFVETIERAHAAAARAAEFGAQLVEYRVDTFREEGDDVLALVEQSPLPCIITCRAAWEGGQFDGSEDERLALLERACSGVRKPAYIDLELAAWQRDPALRARLGKLIDQPGGGSSIDTGLILSSHDFERRPSDLLQKIEAMAGEQACRVIKVAWQARSLRDNLEAFELCRQQYNPTIALCMGGFGLPSRVLAKKFGALLTFAAIDEQSRTAQGQPTVEELASLYRWRKLEKGTQVFGVIGYPVAHSMSPAIHNAGFDAIDYPGVYLPMPIPPEYEHFKATVGAWLDMDELHFRGASVTIPHKENLIRYVREQGGEVEALAERIGAANTLTRREDGTLYASNTDYAAAMDSVCDGLGIAREELKGQRVAVIGAGGAARAIVAGFAAYGATVVVYNRTVERAQQLAEEFNQRDGGGKVVAVSIDKLCDSCCQIYINCTPVGMHPNTDATPIAESVKSGDEKGWGPGTVVFDTIYNPIETRLLREAKAAGCLTIGGIEMFVRQAADQFELWTGREAPRAVFRDVVVDALTR